MARNVSVKLMADVASFVRNVGGAAAGSVKSLTSELDKANNAGKLDHVTTAAMGLGAGLLGVAGYATKFAMDFDKQMSAVQAATHGSSAEIGQLREASLAAGKASQFSATEAAQGVEELAKAGVRTADILGGGLNGALDLAAAGQIDVAEAAETAASAMTQFKLKGDKVPHVADLLAAAAGKAQGSVHDMGMALNQSGLVAAQTGLTIEDTTGTLAAFASAGLTGSDAGTSFKQMLLQLQAPSEISANLMQELGISAYDTAGQFIGITKLAQVLREKLSGLTQEERAHAMAQIFGADATRTASILYENGAEGIQKWIDKTNDAGYAATTAAMKTDNLAGDLERLKGSIETLAIESGSGGTSGLRTLTQGFDRLVGSVSAIPAPVQNAAVVIAGVTGAMLLAGGAAGKMRAATSEMLGQLAETGPMGAKAAGGLGKVADFAGRAAIALAAINTASALMGDSVNAQLPALAKGLADFGRTGTTAGEAARILGDNMGTLRDDMGALDSGFWADMGNGVAGFVEGMTGMGNVMDHSLTHAKERISAIDAALAQLVQSGQGLEAAAAFDQLAKQAGKSGVSVDELRKGLPQYQAALEGAGSQSATAAGQIDGLGGAADKAEDKVGALIKAFDDLFDSQMSIDRATLKYQQGLGSLAEELTHGTRTLATNRDEGLKNRAAVLDQIETIKSLRDARLREGLTLDDANKKYVKDIEGLRKGMLQAGFSKKAVDDLVGAYKKIPGKVNTNVSATGVRPVMEDLSALSNMQYALKKGISYSAAAAHQGDAKSAADRHLLAAGGHVRGPGGPRGDKIPAMLSDYEFVQPADAVDYYGVDVMEAIRKKRINPEDLAMVAGYATGGLVSWPYSVTGSMTRVPSKSEALSVVRPEAPAGGQTLDFIIRAVHSRFPGMNLISGYRPGATTLSGNRSYHALHRAADWPPSYELAKWWNANYKAQTKEFISPWNDLNIHNGARHTYTGAIYRQHNFAGGNAHDHIAMAGGGVINEPVFGYGASGRSYSFGEGYRPETVTPGAGGGNTYQITVNPTPLASPRDIGREIVSVIQEYQRGSGKRWQL